MSERLEQARSYHAAIREVLMREWDPIGVADMPEAADEYDSYISQVHGLLIRREPLHKMVDFLWWVETEHMGLAGNRRRTEQVAERLLRMPGEIAGNAEQDAAVDRGRKAGPGQCAGRSAAEDLRMRRWSKWLTITAAVLAVLTAAGFAYHCHRYPHGRSHCCDKQLMFALLNYADRHGGWFPKGEASPEASLSLLHRDAPESVNANLLRGKTVPEAAVGARLEASELLTPETCGWHYVEGLRKDDAPRLALFWDKAGMGHNGERLSGGGHYVCFVSGSIEYVAGDRWDEFLADQERLRAAVKR